MTILFVVLAWTKILCKPGADGQYNSQDLAVVTLLSVGWVLPERGISRPWS